MTPYKESWSVKPYKNYPTVFTLAALCSVAPDVFAAVQAPPFPVGSENVKIVAGQSTIEQECKQRAHKHHSPVHYKKDMTRDNSVGANSTLRRYGSDVKNKKSAR